jgi:hypothetical protein
MVVFLRFVSRLQICTADIERQTLTACLSMRRVACCPEFSLTPHFSEVGRDAELRRNCFNSFVQTRGEKPLKRLSWT